MKQHTRAVVTGLQLDTSIHTPKDPCQLRMLQSIATETEATRTGLRSDPSWGFPVAHPARGFAPLIKHKRQLETTLADMLPWPALLTLQGCADNAAHSANCTNQDILQYALSICPYEHIVTVLNFIWMSQGITDTAKALSPLIRGLKATEARIKHGASVGGKKSARTRQLSSKTPSVAELLLERERLIKSGKEAREVAGILAQRHGVLPGTIRRKLLSATKVQAA